MAYTVTIKGSGSSSRCYVQIGSTKYYNAKTVEVDENTSIVCYSNGTLSTIYLNDTLLYNNNSSEGAASHTQTVVGNTTIVLNLGDSYVDNKTYYYPAVHFLGPTESDVSGGEHKIMDNDGTIYTISGGLEMDSDGSVYDIEEGSVMDKDGTVYPIEFSTECNPKIFITGTGNGLHPYVLINGTAYTSSAVVEVSMGDTIECHGDPITVNYTDVYENYWGESSGAVYNFTVTGYAHIDLRYTGGSSFNIRSLYVYH